MLSIAIVILFVGLLVVHCFLVFFLFLHFLVNNYLPSPLCILSKAEVNISNNCVFRSSVHNKFLLTTMLCSCVRLWAVAELVQYTGVLQWQN